jgi:hypothetical protein
MIGVTRADDNPTPQSHQISLIPNPFLNSYLSRVNICLWLYLTERHSRGVSPLVECKFLTTLPLLLRIEPLEHLHKSVEASIFPTIGRENPTTRICPQPPSKLVCLQEWVPKAAINADILAHEVQYMWQHMVIACSAQRPLQNADFGVWKQILRNISLRGTAFFTKK